MADSLGVRPVAVPVPPAFLPFAAWIWEGIARITGIPPLLNRDKAREMGQRFWVCDSSKASRELGFATTIPLRLGTQRVAEWYQSHGWL
jgi:nucleoside-diphosphate-sugar epimerase